MHLELFCRALLLYFMGLHMKKIKRQVYLNYFKWQFIEIIDDNT